MKPIKKMMRSTDLSWQSSSLYFTSSSPAASSRWSLRSLRYRFMASQVIHLARMGRLHLLLDKGHQNRLRSHSAPDLYLRGLWGVLIQPKNEHTGNRTQVLGPEIPNTTTMLYALINMQNTTSFICLTAASNHPPQHGRSIKPGKRMTVARSSSQ